jgi:hypothetical protein
LTEIYYCVSHTDTKIYLRVSIPEHVCFGCPQLRSMRGWVARHSQGGAHVLALMSCLLRPIRREIVVKPHTATLELLRRLRAQPYAGISKSHDKNPR